MIVGPLVAFALIGTADLPMVALPVVPRSAWDDAPERRAGHRYQQKLESVIREIVVHHSDFEPPAGVHGILRYHLDVSGFQDIGYHFVITSDGTIYEGRPLDRMGAHAGSTREEKKSIKNDPDYGSIGIVLDGRFEERLPPDAQLKALRALIADLRARFRKIDRVVGHREVRVRAAAQGLTPLGQPKSCPGHALFPWLKAELVTPPAATSDTFQR